MKTIFCQSLVLTALGLACGCGPVMAQVGSGAAGSLAEGARTATSRDGSAQPPDSLAQQKELDTWMAPVKYQFDSTAAAWSNYERNHFDSVTRKFDTSGLSVVQAFTTGLHHKEHGRLNEFVRVHPSYIVSIEALRRTLVPVVDDIGVTKGLYDALDADVRSTPAGQALGEAIDKRLAVGVGHAAPDFTSEDPSGHPIRLSSFRGKYVLLDFWASWCGPCRQENPIVRAAYQKFHARNFEILSVSLDMPGKRDSWLKAIETDGMPWVHVSDLLYWKSPLVKLYGVQSIPQNFLIDPSGKIVAVNLRGEELEKTLKKFL